MPTYLYNKVPLREDDGLGSAWGLELVEGRRWEIFWYVGMVVLGCSLLVAVVVAVVVGVVKGDVQGAFTVPGFLETGVRVGVAIATLSATVDYLW
jgi:hypothetical protein